MLKPFIILSLFATSVAACGNSTSSTTGGTGGKTGSSSAAVTGHVADDSGTDVLDFGGSGAVASTVKVSALKIDVSGATESIAEGAVSADGSFTLDVPVHAGPTLFEGLDAKGTVVVRALLDDVLVAGKSATVQPLTTESSVEAAVMLDMVKSGTAVADVDLVALRARIDAATATLVHDHAVAQMVEAEADVHALGVATLTAQMSEQASLKAALVDATAYAAAELKASDALTAALDAGGANSVKANADFTAAFAALSGQFGLDAAAAATAATDASASAQAAIVATSSSMDLVNAFDHAQASVEAVATTAAVTAAFTKASASADVMAQLQTANADLISQVGAASDAAALTSAFGAWRLAVSGTAAGTGGLVADVLGAALTATAGYTTAITAVGALDASLQTALDAAATASEDKAGAVDATKLAGLVAQAYATFDAGVQAAVTASALPFGAGQGALMTSVLVSSETSF